MRNVTRKLGAIDGSEDDLLKTFEFEKELAKVTVVMYNIRRSSVVLSIPFVDK